jgi:hypothetical protein
MGDNITPPQQAFNWVADVYGLTEEIKARGQVIVGLLQEKAGHLGIFVSGKVAKKEHAEIVSVLHSIEALPPGLWAMNILEAKGADGKVTYDVEFTERRLEEVLQRLNRFERRDEAPFQAAAAVADFNETAYRLFAQPLVQNLSNEVSAEVGRAFHPLRVQHWALSDGNPWLWWLGPAAQTVRAHRQVASPEQPLRRVERMLSEMIGASLDFYRDMRDATSEALFYQIYGNLFGLYPAEAEEAAEQRAEQAQDARALSFVQAALDAITQGGYPEAVARVAALLARRGRPLPLAWLDLRAELLSDYRDLLPDLPRDQARRIRGEQEIIVKYEPERAIETLPQLLSDPYDRERLLTLFDRLLADPRLDLGDPAPAERAMLHRIRRILAGEPGVASGRKQEVTP